MQLKFQALQGREFKQKALQSSLFALFAWLALGLYVENIVLSFFLALSFGLGILGLLSCLPVLERRKHSRLVESQLPFALMNMAVELNLGLGFEEVLEHAAARGNEIGGELEQALREIRGKGASVQEALMHFSERVESQEVKRAVALLVGAYEQGPRASGEAVKMLAKELLHKQRARAKEFSGKLVVYSLFFVAISAVVPALFQSFVIVGSMVLHLTITAQQIMVIVTLVFPAIDAMALYYIRVKTPVFLRG
jgi:pilus assembly protein TadC